MKRKRIPLLLFLLGLACRSATTTIPRTEIVSASFRPGWFGAVFHVGINSDGNVQLRTREWANDQPYEVVDSRRRLSAREVEALRKLIVRAGIAGLRERYELPVSDQDEITIHDPSTSKTVAIYGPQSFCADPSLAAVLDLWNEIVKQTKPPAVSGRRGGYSLCTGA